jgi:hypothetical protein
MSDMTQQDARESALNREIQRLKEDRDALSAKLLNLKGAIQECESDGGCRASKVAALISEKLEWPGKAAHLEIENLQSKVAAQSREIEKLRGTLDITERVLNGEPDESIGADYNATGYEKHSAVRTAYEMKNRLDSLLTPRPDIQLISTGVQLAVFAKRIQAVALKRGWDVTWSGRLAASVLELSEFIEAVRGKGGDQVDEGADVLNTALCSFAVFDVNIMAILRRLGEKLTKLEAGELGRHGTA